MGFSALPGLLEYFNNTPVVEVALKKGARSSGGNFQTNGHQKTVTAASAEIAG